MESQLGSSHLFLSSGCFLPACVESCLNFCSSVFSWRLSGTPVASAAPFVVSYFLSGALSHKSQLSKQPWNFVFCELWDCCSLFGFYFSVLWFGKCPPDWKLRRLWNLPPVFHLLRANWYLKSRSSCSILSPHEGKLNTYNYCHGCKWKLVLPFILKTTFNLWIHLAMLSIEFWYSTCACIFVNIFMLPSCPNRGTEMVGHSNRRAHWYTYTKRVSCPLPMGNVFLS